MQRPFLRRETSTKNRRGLTRAKRSRNSTTPKIAAFRSRPAQRTRQGAGIGVGPAEGPLPGETKAVKPLEGPVKTMVPDDGQAPLGPDGGTIVVNPPPYPSPVIRPLDWSGTAVLLR